MNPTGIMALQYLMYSSFILLSDAIILKSMNFCI